MRSYEVGEVIRVVDRAIDEWHPNRVSILGLTGTVEIFGPDKNPEEVVADRGAPDASTEFEYREGAGYIAALDTSGLAAGTCTLRTQLSGDDYERVAYEAVEIRE